MRRLLKMGLSCNLEVVERLAVQLSSNERVEKNNCNVRKNRMGSGVESESRCLCPESSTRDFLLSFLRALSSPFLSSPLLSSLCVRATFGIALSKFTGNLCDVCLALRATQEKMALLCPGY